MSAVLFNDLSLFRQKSGVGHYAAQLLKHLPGEASDIEIVRLSALGGVRWVAGAMSQVTRSGSLTERGGSSSPVLSLKVYLQSALDRYLGSATRRSGCALFHEPDAIALPSRLPTIVTVHDLSVLLHPQWHPAIRVKKYERYFMRSLKQAKCFVAVSQATANDLMEHLKVKPDRIVVIPEAPRFTETSEQALQSVKLALGLPENYFLFVGNLEPRKNVAGLMRAYSRLPASLRAQYPLVLVGGWGWRSSVVKEMLGRPPWDQSVRHLGYLPDESLSAVMQGATALVYPSFYEGFGLPPLEAMGLGTPVIATHAGSLAEVLGDAALVVEPEDETGMTSKMREIAESTALQEKLRLAGLAQAAKFSWQRTARETAAVYRRLLC